MGLIIETIEGEFWDHWFQSMSIPGGMDGIAVLKEESFEYCLTSVGREDGACFVLRMRGDPLCAVSQTPLTEREFSERMQMLDRWPCDRGLIRAHDVLDGEGFLIKGRIKGSGVFSLGLPADLW